MGKQSDLIKNAIRSVTLESILLKSSTADVAVSPGFITPDITKVDIKYSFSHMFEPEAKALFSFVAVDVKGLLTLEAKKKNPDLKLEGDKLFGCCCVFVARYSSEKALDEEECESFTRANALFNVYPYLREHTSSEFHKMGLQGVCLPLLKPESL